VIALLGNLSRDMIAGQPPKVGGAPYHAARALRRLLVPTQIVARCAVADREELFVPLVRLGSPTRYVRGAATASFAFSYDGDHRRMEVAGIGDAWLPGDVPALPGSIRWVHVAPLLRSDFPPETLAAIGRRHRILLDGQGLVRVPELGPLQLEADFDPDGLRHVWALKLADEEAETIGDLDALPVREILVTHGSRGVTVHAGGTTVQVRGRTVHAKDPTGAGDAFCVAYTAARASHLPPEAAARRAVALVASFLDAR
jgi:sugar/nucleoside kinase (ribokinase family)